MRQWKITAAVVGAALSTAQAAAPTLVPEVRLYRLDCGRGTLPKAFFNDSYAYPEGVMIDVTASCYLIRHGDQYLLWDTGFGADTLGDKARGLTQPLGPQLAAIGVTPEQIGHVGISHSHADHTGQAKDFPRAKLLIGAKEHEALFGPDARLNAQAEPLRPWADGSNVDKVAGDKDVYGDGSVVMLALPGHTPGHMGLLVRLRRAGPVVLSGDQYHFRENRRLNGVPGFNADRAQTLASSERVESILRHWKARLVIQHDRQDNAELPKAPAYLD